MTDTTPKGRYIGKPIDDLPDDERRHFMKCPGCGRWFDMRDLGQVAEHVGELPHGGEEGTEQ